MIQIDMEMPDRCGNCPCFHAENPMYCQAITDYHQKIGAPYRAPRPEWCPLQESPGAQAIAAWNKRAPAVPSVQLEKLKVCEWLALNSIDLPCERCPYFVNDSCAAIGDASKPCPNSADDLRRAIRKMMEE